MLKPGCKQSGRRMGTHWTCDCASGSLDWWSPSMGMWPAPGAWFWFGTRAMEEIHSAVPLVAPHRLLSHHFLRCGRGRESWSRAGYCYSHSTETTEHTKQNNITNITHNTLHYQHYLTLPYNYSTYQHYLKYITLSTIPTLPTVLLSVHIIIRSYIAFSLTSSESL